MTYFIYEIDDELLVLDTKRYPTNLLVEVVFAYSTREALEQYLSRRAA